MRALPPLAALLLACTSTSAPPAAKDARDAADDLVDAVALDADEVAATDASPDTTARDAPDEAVDASTDAAPDAPVDDAGVRCPTAFRFAPAVGARPPSRVEVTGEWTAWSDPGVAMRAGADGAWTVETPLPPGLHGYKFLVEGTWISDDTARRRKYVGGVENPAVLVDDCRLPRLALASHTVARPAAGAGTLRAEVTFAPGIARDALDPATLRATLRRDGVDRALPAPTLDAVTGRARVDLTALADGKYTVLVEASD